MRFVDLSPLVLTDTSSGHSLHCIVCLLRYINLKNIIIIIIIIKLKYISVKSTTGFRLLNSASKRLWTDRESDCAQDIIMSL